MIVNIAYYREVHIDQASGHDRVMAGLADHATVRVLEPCLPKRAPRWLVRRLGPPLGEHPHVQFYEPSALRLEYAAMRRLVASPDEVVHVLQGDSHYNYTAWARLIPRRRRGTYITTFHLPPESFEEMWRFRRKKLRLDAIDGMTVLSREQLEYFRPLVGERVRFVPYGVNRRVFNPPERRPERDEVRVISTGAWLRDPVLLRDTIERATAEDDRISFTVLAPADYLDKLGTPPRTTLGSGVYGADLVRAYHDADVFLHPARLSSGSTAMLEAMACGLPVAVPDVGGVRDYVDEASAEIVAPNDPVALADGVLRLAADPDRRRRMGAMAEEQSRTHDWAYIAWEYLVTYREALARRGRQSAAG
jgi:glycosyltransferase involved in cell wall biosynthesis